MGFEMRYPLKEKIGHPDLLVGREKELRFLNPWLANIPRALSKSRVMLARRKSGKTAFIQRIFNRLWSENGPVIPFYIDISETKVWYPRFAEQYFCTFLSQYISFLERDTTLVQKSLDIEQIREYALTKSHRIMLEEVESFLRYKAEKSADMMWHRACHAPHRLAGVMDIRFLVMIDEFQNLAAYIYPDEQFQTKPIETMPGSFHSLSESKIAPMLVTGSYVGWLIQIIDEYLEAGRLKHVRMSPYLTPEEGLEAVYRYAEVYGMPITNETATQINALCMSDPFFISCVILSELEGKDLTTADGVVNTVNYEISDRNSEMSRTWREYLDLTLQRVNDRNAKSLLLHLSKHNDRYWTPKELKEALHLEIDANDIQRKLMILVNADIIKWGESDIDFQGLQDGTLNLVLRKRFEKEIDTFEPNYKQEFSEKLAALKAEKNRLQGQLNQVSGVMAEYQLATELRSRKRFTLSDYFSGVTDAVEVNILDVRQRFPFQRADGKAYEIDVRALSEDGRIILAEVKKTQVKIGVEIVSDFWDKVAAYKAAFPAEAVLAVVLALGGFTDDAQALCQARGIGTATAINYFLK